MHISDGVNRKPKSTLARSAHSLGSLGGIFSGTKRDPGISTEGFSKSEETLDSMKHSVTETEDTDSDTEENSDKTTDTEAKTVPPIVVRKFVK